MKKIAVMLLVVLFVGVALADAPAPITKKVSLDELDGLVIESGNYRWNNFGFVKQEMTNEIRFFASVKNLKAKDNTATAYVVCYNGKNEVIAAFALRASWIKIGEIITADGYG